MKRFLSLLGTAALLGALTLPAAGGAVPRAHAAKAKVKRVSIKDFDYSPRKITVSRGTKVTWTDKDATNHTVTFSARGLKSPGNLNERQSKSLTFKKAGSFKYLCDYHPNMHGTVVVR